jgi:hypothetical protein
MKEAVAIERTRLKFWKAIAEEPEFKNFLEGLRKEAEDKKEKNISFQKAEMTTELRACVAAIRDLLARVNNKTSGYELEEAKRRLREFEDDNALFVHDERAVKSVGVEAVESADVRRAFEGLAETIADAGADVEFVADDGTKTSMSASEARAVVRKSKRVG